MPVKWSGPFSKTTTCQPASASSMAATDPPAPLPITTAVGTGAASHRAEERQHVGDHGRPGHRIRPVAALHLLGGVAARLDVAGKADVLPAGQAAVAAVLRDRVQALDGVLEQ